MAKKEKGKRGSKAEFSIRRVKTKEDRKRPSVFMRLKTDEQFRGIALFEPDPELKDNPGYYEYYDHYDKQANQYVPCAGEKCPFCAANDNPSTRALTAWYFPDNDASEQIKLFTLNYSTIEDMADEAEENDGILGKKVRIKRLSDKGDYKVRVVGDKPLTKKELAKLIKQLEAKFESSAKDNPGGLEGVVLTQLKKQMERLKALEAMDDDDEDEEDSKPKSRKGRAVEEEDDDDEDEEEDDDDDDEDEDEDEESEDDDDDEDEDEDEEEDEDEDEEEESEDEETEEEESEEISGVFEVVKVQEKDEILELKNDDGKFKMWVGSGVDVDYDEVKKGVSVNIEAAQDDEGDWIITEISVAKPKGGKGKGGKGKGGKKK